MDKLMNRLERLSVAIGELNPAASAPTTPTTTGTAKKSERHHAASWQERKRGIPAGNAKLLLDAKAGSDEIDVVEPTPSPSLQEKRKMMLTRQKESISQ